MYTMNALIRSHRVCSVLFFDGQWEPSGSVGECSTSINPLPYNDAFYAFANRADPDQAALVRAA